MTKQAERSRVPVNEWQEVIGHEKGLTYGTYNPDGLDMKHKQEVIEIIRYDEVGFKTPKGIYKAKDKLENWKKPEASN